MLSNNGQMPQPGAPPPRPPEGRAVPAAGAPLQPPAAAASPRTIRARMSGDKPGKGPGDHSSNLVAAVTVILFGLTSTVLLATSQDLFGRPSFFTPRLILVLALLATGMAIWAWLDARSRVRNFRLRPRRRWKPSRRPRLS